MCEFDKVDKTFVSDLYLSDKDQLLMFYFKITFWKRELWMAERRISICIWKTWKSHAIIPSFECAMFEFAITNSIENLRFDKEGYFNVLYFYGLFYKKNRKCFLSCSRIYVIETCILGRLRELPAVYIP